jgi:hypothetical protein
MLHFLHLVIETALSIPGPWALLAVGIRSLNGFHSSFNKRTIARRHHTFHANAVLVSRKGGAVADRYGWAPSAAYSVCNTPIFEDIMGKRSFLFKLLGHD